jgi:adenosine deaminase
MLARNSFLGSFLPDEAVAAHCAAIDAWMAEAA